MRGLRLLTLLLISSFLFGCTATSTHTAVARSSDGTADAYIRSALPRFQAAFNSGDWDAISRFYTDDAVLLPPNADAVTGRSGARAVFASLAPMKPTMSLTPNRVVQVCDMAYDYGTYTMNLTGPDGAAIADRGKYLAVWRQGANGEWLIVADTFNTSLPMPH